MKKLIVNCSTQQTEEIELLQDEIVKRELEQQEIEQQVLIDSLKPTVDEVSKAIREIEMINLLTDLGVIV